MFVVKSSAFLLFCLIFLKLSRADDDNPNDNTFTSQNMTETEYDDDDDDNDDNDDDDDDDDDEEGDLVCRWKWSRWSVCTKDCDSGNTTRRGLCFCDGLNVPVADNMCSKAPPLQQLYDVVPCNEQKCSDKATCNKGCWMKLIHQRLVMNMTDGIFNCSNGCPDDNSCPRGKSYSQVLYQPVPYAENAEWYYLAKEWYAAVLNKANGVKFPTLALQAMDQARTLLENCTGWGPDQIKTLAKAYATKEKLNRANNGIGGLNEVDQQVSILVGGGLSDETEQPSETSPLNRSFIVLSIVIPLMVLVLALTVLASWVYYRRKTDVVVAHAEFPDEDDNVVQHIPLQPVVVHTDAGDSESDDKAD